VSTYLITGGAGFIGSHLTERLLDDGHDVLALDDLSTGSLENIEKASRNRRFKFARGSVQDFSIVSELVAQAETVFHLAATVGVMTVMKHPVATMRNNVRGTENVLEAAARSTPKKKVIVTSTSEVYGRMESVPFLEEGGLMLGPTQTIRWGYAASKLVDEFLALAYRHEFSVPTVVVRPFNTIGPRQTGEYGMVVPRFFEQALDGEDLTVFGDGTQTRCFTYVSDTVEWLVRLARFEQAVGEIFNLGNTEEVSIRELAERIIRLTGAKVSIRSVPYEKAYGEGFEDMQRRVPSIKKVAALIGHSPQITLDEALERIYLWVLARRGEISAKVARGAVVQS